MLRAFGFMRGNILVMTVCESLWRVSVDVIWPFLSLYVLALGGRYETIGVVMALGNLASMILYPLGGYIADYQGRIRIIGYMTFGYAAAFLIPALTNTWQWLAVGMFAQSLVTFYSPALLAMTADSIPPERRGIGFATSTAVPSAVGIASPMIGGWLIETYGIGRAMHGLFLLGFFVGLLVAAIRLKFLKETLERPDQIEITPGRVPHLLGASYRSVLGTLMEAPGHLLVLSLLVSLCVFFVSIPSSFWIIRAQEVMGVTTRQWGTLLLVTGAINVALSIPAGGLIDRLSKRWVAGACLIVGSVPALLFLRSTSFGQVLALSVAATLTNIFLNPAIQALFADMTPREKRGRIMAAIGGGGIWLMGGAWGSSVLSMTLRTAGSLLSGYIYHFDRSLPWYILSAALAVLGVLFIILVREPEEAEM